jgi:hypothetical protein
LDITTHIGDTGELQQPLHSAILAELAMQHRQHEVQTDHFVPPLLQHKQSAHTPVRRQHDRPTTTVLPIDVRTATKPPSTTLRDPDPERLILFGIEMPGDLLRRLDGDGMLFGTAPEHNSDFHIQCCFLLSKFRQLIIEFSTVSLSAWSV